MVLSLSEHLRGGAGGETMGVVEVSGEVEGLGGEAGGLEGSSEGDSSSDESSHKADC